MRYFPFVLCFALGCSDGPPPDNVPEPALWLMANFDAPEKDVTPQVLALRDYAAVQGRDAELFDRRFQPAPLDPSVELVGQYVPPGLTMDGQIRLGVTAFSEHPVSLFRQNLNRTTPMCWPPDDLEDWTRTFTFGEECFPLSACRNAVASEEIRYAGPGEDARFITEVDYRLIQASDSRDALVARRRLTLTGQTPLENSLWAIEAWVPDVEDSGVTWRITTVWLPETTRDPSAWQDALLQSIDQAFQGEELFLDAGLPCEL